MENHQSKILRFFITILTLFLFIPQLSLACENNQLNGSLIELERDKMEKFDKKLFEQKRKVGEYEYCYTLANEVTIRLVDSGDDYFESRTQGTLQKTRTFYKSTLSLKTEATNIHGILIDSARGYDENGRFTGETQGSLTSEQVNKIVRKVKADFNVDLTARGYSSMISFIHQGKRVVFIRHRNGQEIYFDVPWNDEQFVMLGVDTMQPIIQGVVRYNENSLYPTPMYYIDDKEIKLNDLFGDRSSPIKAQTTTLVMPLSSRYTGYSVAVGEVNQETGWFECPRLKGRIVMLMQGQNVLGDKHNEMGEIIWYKLTPEAARDYLNNRKINPLTGSLE